MHGRACVEYLLQNVLTSDAIMLQDGDWSHRFWAGIGFEAQDGANPMKVMQGDRKAVLRKIRELWRASASSS